MCTSVSISEGERMGCFQGREIWVQAPSSPIKTKPQGQIYLKGLEWQAPAPAPRSMKDIQFLLPCLSKPYSQNPSPHLPSFSNNTSGYGLRASDVLTSEA